MSTVTEHTHIDMKNLCVFCFAEDNYSSSEVKTEEYWPYIQPLQWKGNSPPKTPTMCTVCTVKIEEIAKCHREIVELEQKLYMVRKQLDVRAKDIRERMEKYKTNEKSHQKIATSSEKRSGVKRSYDGMMASTSLPSSFNAANSSESYDSTCGNEIDSDKAVLEKDVDIDLKEELSEDSEAEDCALPEPEPFEDSQDPLEDLDECKSANSHSQNFADEETRSKIIKSSDNSKPTAITVLKQPEISRRRIGYCVICGKKRLLKYLLDHMKCHVGNYAIQCQNCLISFPSPLSFSYFHNSHQRRCKVKPIFPCEICGEELKYNEASRHLNHHETHEKNFTCPIPSCGKTFAWKQSLEIHLGEHEQRAKNIPGNKINPCEICGESFPLSKSIMHEHMVSHVGEFAFQCPIPKCRRTFASRYSEACKRKGSCKWTPPKTCEECEEDFDGLQNLRGHLRRHETSEKSFTCPIPTCGNGFTVKQSLEFHLGSHAFHRQLQSCTACPKNRNGTSKKLAPNEMEAHLKDKHGVQNIFKCEHCTFVYANQEDLVEHLSTHVKSGLSCHLCTSKQVFRDPRKLRQHYFEDHQIGRQYLCENENCDYASGTLDALKQHKRKLHESRLQKLYQCQICENKPAFSNADTLTTHNITLHSGEKLKCNFCTETFTAKTTRDKHEKYIHRGVERPQFTCAECDISFMTQISLKNHMNRIHLNKTFLCNECEKSFHSNELLRRHVRIDHEGVRCVCETCGKSFKDRKLLEIHMRIHTGERPYLCKLCGLSFRQHGSWYNHTKKGHEKKGDKFVPKGTFDRTEKRK